MRIKNGSRKFVLCIEGRLQEGESRIKLGEVSSGEAPGNSNGMFPGQDYSGIQSAYQVT